VLERNQLKCDLKKLDELLHEELLFSIPNGQTITKAIDIETYGSGNMKIDEIKSSEQEINLIEDNAIVSVVIDMKGRYFDYSLDGKYKIIRIWKLFNSHFKVIAGSSIGSCLLFNNFSCSVLLRGFVRGLKKMIL